MKYRLVNILVIASYTFSAFFSSCGLQLNRNRVRLLNNATSISIFEIKNGSYISGLDIDLKNKLIGALEQQSIMLYAPQRADLVLSCEITSLNISKSKYSLDAETNKQAYQFRFDVKGKITVLDNRYREDTSSKKADRNSDHILGSRKYRAVDGKSIIGAYLLTTFNEDLSRNELNKGKDKVVTALKNTIVRELSLTF